MNSCLIHESIFLICNQLLKQISFSIYL